MKVSLSWLREYVPVEMDYQILADRLTMAGLEVEIISDRYEYLDKVKVGKITKITAHPNADRLRICLVETGDKSLSVVCGANNINEGDFVPVALPGTCFPDGNVLKKGVIRGESSEGMLCSEKELGLGEDESGIMILDSSCTSGTCFVEALNLSDIVFEIGLTPNRPDCLSIIGVAREVAAMENTKAAYPKVNLKANGVQIEDLTSVTIENPDHCPRYAARLISDVKIGPSPFWLKDRLASVGIRSINNIVDITNFVMMETCQPLHAFDFDFLEDHKIIVKTASQGEVFTTLDAQERKLEKDMLMICDGRKPVAVAGVMGGINSEIQPDTTRVLLESAYFNPVSIRRTAKRLGLSTEASHRFERGIDPDGCLNAVDRAAELILELAGGTLAKGIIDEYPNPIAKKSIPLSVIRTNQILGTSVDCETICNQLRSIEFKIEEIDKDNLNVSPPSYRVDVERPQDLMEEIARLTGYNNIPVVSPVAPIESLKPSKRFKTRLRIKTIMSGFGFSEAINYSFIGESSVDKLCLKSNDERRNFVFILNPLTEDQAVMRSSLIPGLLSTMHRNLKQQSNDLKLFETGKIFISTGKDSLPQEQEIIAGLWTGRRNNVSWYAKDKKCDFYDIKGVIEGFFKYFQLPVLFIKIFDNSFPYYRSGYSAEIIVKDKQVGTLGEVNPDVLKNFDLKQASYIFELNFEELLPLIPEDKNFAPIPRFPSTSRDITLILDQNIEVQKVLNAVQKCNEKLVESTSLLDVYEGKPIDSDKKSVSFRITYRSWEDTLKDTEVNKLHDEIAGSIIREFKAGLPI
ncbi:Phenylalanine--tRNA ligase beta subunit [Candidatus Magnetomoraceae bacterium gMMP-15]